MEAVRQKDEQTVASELANAISDLQTDLSGRLEALNGEFKQTQMSSAASAAGLAVLRKRLAQADDALQALQADADRRMGLLENDIAGVASRFDGMDEELGRIRQDVEDNAGQTEASLLALQQDADDWQASVRNTVNNLDEATKSEMTRLEAELTVTLAKARKVETSLGAQDQRIDELSGGLESIRSETVSTAEKLNSTSEVTNRIDNTLAETVGVQKTLLGNVAALQRENVSLDIVSAVRSLRPLWLAGSAVETVALEKEIEHGHVLMMAVMADAEKEQPGLLAGKTLIEIGSTRELNANQKSTQKLAIFTSLIDMNFITVDMDAQNTNRVREAMRLLNPRALAVTEKGEDFLGMYDGPIDFIYLDAFDFDHGQHSEERQLRYEAGLNTRISDEACWKMHRICAQKIKMRMNNGGIVVLDDTWVNIDGEYEGKSKLAMPFILKNGFELIAQTEMTCALCRVKGGKETIEPSVRTQ